MPAVPYAVKRAIQRAANRFGYRLVQARDAARSIDVFDLMIRREVAADPDFFFVQVGANDGMSDDPLRRYVREFGLRGVLIEPLPAVFAELVKNYADQPQLRFENLAVADRAGTATLYTPGGGASDLRASFDPTLARRELRPGGRIETVTVPTETLAAVLARHGVGRLGLLQIDAEGYDAKILASVDLTAVRPTIIRFEHINLPRAEYDACTRRLADHGYRLLAEGIDTLAYLQPTAGD